MTIADQIKQFHVESKVYEFENDTSYSIKNWNDFVQECEEKSVNIDQDWDAESTTYEFADGSTLVWCGENVVENIWTYGTK
jgi:hypothetical protein